MSFKIAISADNHLRDRQLGRADRGDDFRAAFKQIIDYAITHKLDAICFAGDVIDTTRPSPANMQFLQDMHDRTIAAELPVLVISGDHDNTTPHWISILRRKADKAKVGGFYLLDNPNKPFEVLHNMMKEPPLTVLGLPFIGKDKFKFLAMEPQLPKADVLIWHTSIQEFCGFPIQDAIKLDELPRNKYAVIGVGDIHTTLEARLEDGTLVVSPGSTELVAQNEISEKSFYVVTLYASRIGNAIAERIPLKTRPVHRYKCQTEEDVAKMLVELGTLKVKNPLVFVDYKSNLLGVPARLYATLDAEKAIIRLRRLSDDCRGLTEAETGVADGEEKVPADFVELWFAPGTGLFDVAVKLCKEETNVSEVLDEYISRRMLAIEKEAAIAAKEDN